jgi:hypothetical protein
MQEYYIRKEGDEDSRGPFTVEQLSSLAEAGQIDRQTFYYDAVTEKWVEVQSDSELVKTLFPQRKKLSIRKKSDLSGVNRKLTEEEEPITVEEMLAAAEGRTEETKDKRDLSMGQARAALWGLRIMSVIMLTSAAGLLVSNMDALSNGEFGVVMGSPLVVIGIIDLLLGVLLFLELTTIYSFVRIRATIGIGFFGLYFLASGETILAGAAALGSLGLIVLTLVANMRAVIFFGILGLAGMGGFAYYMLS